MSYFLLKIKRQTQINHDSIGSSNFEFKLFDIFTNIRENES